MTSDARETDIYGEDEAARERALQCSRLREWLVLAGMIWSAALSILALVSGSSAFLRSQAELLAPKRIGPVMPYTFIGTILSFLASLPLSYFSGYVVEHRFGLSNQTRWAWLTEQLKGLAVSVALLTPLAQGAYWIIRRYPRRWWAVLSGLTIPFTVLLSNLAPILLLPLFNKFEPLKDEALARRIRDLAARQGVNVSAVLQMDMSKQTKKANAMFTGVGNTKRIVLGDTLLEKFTPDEVEVVLAHELGHQVHRDLWKLIALGAPVTLVSFFTADRLLPLVLSRFGKRFGLKTEEGAADIAALPLLGLLGSAAGLVLTPILNAIVRNLVEHPADRYALELTGKRGAFISAMEKLGRMNLANPKPAALVKYLLYDHPPLQERIEFARHFEKE